MAASPSHGAIEGREHRLAVRVYYEDTDFTGVVYHAGYLRFFERGRTEFLRTVGIGHAELLAAEQPLAFVVAHMDIDFVRPAGIDDALDVATAYDAIKGPRVFISQAIRRGGELIAAARVTVACIGLDRRPKKPPPMLRARLTPYLAPDAGDGPAAPP
jgi:acyl-CoA thioester hydrolase